MLGFSLLLPLLSSFLKLTNIRSQGLSFVKVNSQHLVRQGTFSFVIKLHEVYSLEKFWKYLKEDYCFVVSLISTNSTKEASYQEFKILKITEENEGTHHG